MNVVYLWWEEKKETEIRETYKDRIPRHVLGVCVDVQRVQSHNRGDNSNTTSAENSNKCHALLFVKVQLVKRANGKQQDDEIRDDVDRGHRKVRRREIVTSCRE